jgi:FAD/FMN-containing dehydrogenase
MSKISAEQRAFLEEKFGSRVTFHKTERKLYGHDIAAMPGLFRPLIGETIPEAVVQPESEAELSEVVQWAAEKNIPLTPRGKATSGYGGAVPLKKGLVVDFYRMKKIIHIDPDAKTARVESGVVWEKLDKELARHGLTLRLYPTSYPSSTAGGWLAQGGAGIGSYEAGWFRENVLSARAVLPTGEVREFSGSGLDLIADAEGTTGFITQVTLKVQPLEELDVVSIGCPNPHDLQRLIETIIARDLPIWSLMFINPRMAELKNRAPLMEHNGHPVEERVLLPAA